MSTEIHKKLELLLRVELEGKGDHMVVMTRLPQAPSRKQGHKTKTSMVISKMRTTFINIILVLTNKTRRTFGKEKNKKDHKTNIRNKVIFTRLTIPILILQNVGLDNKRNGPRTHTQMNVEMLKKRRRHGVVQLMKLSTKERLASMDLKRRGIQKLVNGSIGLNRRLISMTRRILILTLCSISLNILGKCLRKKRKFTQNMNQIKTRISII